MFGQLSKVLKILKSSKRYLRLTVSVTFVFCKLLFAHPFSTMTTHFRKAFDVIKLASTRFEMNFSCLLHIFALNRD